MAKPPSYTIGLGPAEAQEWVTFVTKKTWTDPKWNITFLHNPQLENFRSGSLKIAFIWKTDLLQIDDTFSLF